MIGARMKNIAGQVLTLRKQLVVARRKKSHRERSDKWGVNFNLSDREKRLVSSQGQQQIDGLESVLQAAGRALRSHASNDWIRSFVRMHGARQPELHALLMLMQTKLLRPLPKMNSKTSLELFFTVFQQVTRKGDRLQSQKRRLDRKIYSIPQSTKYSNKRAAKLTVRRLPHVLNVSVTDALYRQAYRFLSELQSQERVKILVNQGLQSEIRSVRALSAHALGSQSDSFSGDALVNQLEREQAHQVQIELVKAIGRRNLQSAEDAVQSMIKGTKMPVQYAAVHVLSRIGTMKSVPVLIDRLEDVSGGRITREIIDSLEYMTGQTFGRRLIGWRDWWKKNRGNGLKPPAQRDQNLARVKKKKNRDKKQGNAAAGQTRAIFYETPIDSNRVLFVVDASKSMHRDAKYTRDDNDKPRNKDGPSVPNLPDNPTKMQVAKYELMRSINALQKKQLFNIVFFAGYETIWYQKSLLPAKSNVKRKAFRFIQKVEMRYATAIFDALDLGFMVGEVGGQPMSKEVVQTGPGKIGPDTIYLVTDGKPAYGQYDNEGLNAPVYNTFIEKLNKMNQFRLMKIHGIMAGEGGGFLKRITNETLYYPDGKQRPEWWIRPGSYTNVTK